MLWGIFDFTWNCSCLYTQLPKFLQVCEWYTIYLNILNFKILLPVHVVHLYFLKKEDFLKLLLCAVAIPVITLWFILI